MSARVYSRILNSGYKNEGTHLLKSHYHALELHQQSMVYLKILQIIIEPCSKFFDSNILEMRSGWKIGSTFYHSLAYYSNFTRRRVPH